MCLESQLIAPNNVQSDHGVHKALSLVGSKLMARRTRRDAKLYHGMRSKRDLDDDTNSCISQFLQLEESSPREHLSSGRRHRYHRIDLGCKGAPEKMERLVR